MKIFPQPKKTEYTGELKSDIKEFKLLKNDFGSELDYGLSKLKLSDNGFGLSIFCDETYKTEQYKIVLDNLGVKITASNKRGAWNAIITLRQIIKHSDICCVVIEDEPDLKNRGYVLSIRRLLKMSEFKKLIDLLSDLKYNQLQLITDNTVFETLELNNNSGELLSLDDMKELDDYCKLNMIELVPSINSFGHMHSWLNLEKYRDLAIAPDGFYRTDEYNRTSLQKPGTLNPYNPDSFKLIDKLYSWILQGYSTTNINVGCDETFDLGEGRCKELAETVGKNKIYTDYMNKLNDICKKHDKKMMFWADMIVDDVEALKRMPEDSVALTWGYEEEHPFEKQCQNLKESGLSYYVCPGTSAWGSVVGRSSNMMLNQLSAAENAKKYGAEGYLLTEWADCGTIQTHTVTYLPIAYGAGVSWGVSENSDINNAFSYLDENMFYEEGFSEFLFNCGEAYKLEAYKRFNHAVVVTVLYTKLEDNVYMYDQKIENFENIIEFANEKLNKLCEFKNCPIEYIDEIRLNLKMLISFSKVCIVKLNGTVPKEELIIEFEELKKEHKNLWEKKCRLNGVENFLDASDKIIQSLKNI